MTDKENYFTPKMREKSEQELQEIVDNKEKFQESALLAAIWELERREKAGNEHAEIIEQIETKKKQAEENVDNSFEIPKDIAQSIKKAAYILFAIIPIGLVNSVLLNYFTGGEVFAETRNVVTAVLTVVVMLFFSYMILIGRNWARVTFLVLFLLGALIRYSKCDILFCYISDCWFYFSNTNGTANLRFDTFV